MKNALKRKETLSIKEFMNKKEDVTLNETPKRTNLTAYSLYINPAAFFDPTFILIGCGVVAVAVLEKKMAENGLVSIASFLSTVLRLALPGVALGSIIYLINHSSFLL
ncbi:hypothetical protein [Sinorhizobium meliloti]|uniref:hypothetical protein n=1 Tax=Rhizobium meliloti TaxID=382 RepID=UPI000FDB1027|nr:hypothetical protein [Sinorhizobium meliloti]RVP93284.1 hypothetical protein CN069_33945 [Sinorhizobium meliloti]